MAGGVDTLANLQGKVNANNALVVTLDGGAANATTVTATTAVVIGAATTSGVRLDLESGSLAVREGDDSAYAPLLASTGTFSSLLTSGDHAVGAAQYRYWVGRVQTSSPADGTFRIQNQNVTNTIDLVLADWGTTLTAEAVALANDASVLIGAATSGTVHISYPGDAAIFLARGTANASSLASGSATFTVTKDNASTVNFYYDTNGYYLQNKTGGSLNFRVIVSGA